MQRLSRALVVAVMVLFAQSASATLYDFSWSGNSFSATGTMELSNLIGVGESFDAADVLALEVELFDGAVSVAMVDFPFSAGETLEGTRNASSLSIIDLFFGISAAGSNNFGCEAVGCLFGTVLFRTPSTPSGQVEFGSTAAARESFVFTQVPEPGTQLLQALALVTIAGMRSRRAY